MPAGWAKYLDTRSGQQNGTDPNRPKLCVVTLSLGSTSAGTAMLNMSLQHAADAGALDILLKHSLMDAAQQSADLHWRQQ